MARMMVILGAGIAAALAAAVAASDAPASQPATTRPVAAEPAPPLVQAKVAVRRPMGMNARGQREVQRNTLKQMPDGGIFSSIDELVHFTLAGGRVRAQWNAPARIVMGQPRRIRIQGCDADWMVNAFNNGQQAYYTISRYDFSAPEDDFWMISFSFHQGAGATTVYAVGGDSCDVMRLYYTQQANAVILNLHAWENNRPRPVLAATAADLFKLRGEHPQAVHKYLAPVLRRLTSLPILRPGAGDVYRVFTSIPADSLARSKVEALLPALGSPLPDERDRATRELDELGSAGTLAALRMDSDLLSPEQRNRLAELVAINTRMGIEDAASATGDVHFLLDCLDDEDLRVQRAAAGCLEKALGRKIEINPGPQTAHRTLAIEKFRSELFPSIPLPSRRGD